MKNAQKLKKNVKRKIKIGYTQLFSNNETDL